MKLTCRVASFACAWIVAGTVQAADGKFQGTWEIEKLSCSGKPIEANPSFHQMAFVIKGSKMDLVYTGSTNVIMSSGDLEKVEGFEFFRYDGSGALPTHWEIMMDRPSETSLHMRETKPDAAPHRKASEGPLGLEGAIAACPGQGELLDIVLKKIPDFSY